MMVRPLLWPSRSHLSVSLRSCRPSLNAPPPPAQVSCAWAFRTALLPASARRIASMSPLTIRFSRRSTASTRWRTLHASRGHS
nr:MAG: hypothetical protein [Sanya fiers-like virus 47]